jgi:hypothetical protein
MTRVATRLPRACGVNVTVIEHDALTASVPGQLLVCEKSPGFDPMILNAPTVSGAVAFGAGLLS